MQTLNYELPITVEVASTDAKLWTEVQQAAFARGYRWIGTGVGVWFPQDDRAMQSIRIEQEGVMVCQNAYKTKHVATPRISPEAFINQMTIRDLAKT